MKTLIEAAIAAFRERPSMDPETGADGVLRDEWRVRDVADFSPEDLVAAWGDDWRRARPFASHVLEHRYIRRGTVEPWEPFDAANSSGQALEYIHDKATALAPELVELQRKRTESAAAWAKKEAEERAQKQAAEIRAAAKRRSEDAFAALYNTASGKALADRWNAFCSAQQDKEKLQADPEFMDLYKAAMGAESLGTKRKAVSAFLKRYAP